MHNILIVEDDAIILSDMEAVLRDAGCEVDACASAEAALDLIRRDPARFDLVITDLRFGEGMDGASAAFRIREIEPSMKLLICSGHIATDATDYPPGATFIGKPFSAARLAGIVTRLLAQDTPLIPPALRPQAIDTWAE